MTYNDLLAFVEAAPDTTFLAYWNRPSNRDTANQIWTMLKANGFVPERLVTWIKASKDAHHEAEVNGKQTKLNIVGALHDIQRRG